MYIKQCTKILGFYSSDEKKGCEICSVFVFLVKKQLKGALKKIFCKKKNEKVCGVKKKVYLCIVKIGTGSSDERLDYGVMVTQQILVLFFQVRVLVVQPKG